MPRTEKIVDSDAHVFEPLDIWLRYLEAPLPLIMTSIPGLENGNSTGNDGPASRFPLGFIPETGREDLLQLAADAETRLKVMDDEGIDEVALFPTLRLGGVRHPQLAPALFRAYNNWLAEHCASNKERLLGVAMIRFRNRSSQSKRRSARGETDHRGLLYFTAPVDNRNLDHPAYEPLWDIAEQLNVPALVPSAQVSVADRWRGTLTAIAFSICTRIRWSR